MTTRSVKCLLKLTLLYVVAVICAGEQCPAASDTCRCEFDGESPDGGQSDSAGVASKSEVMAAAVGALSPMLVAGGGFAVWKIFKGGLSDSRPDSAMSEDSTDRKVFEKSRQFGNDGYSRRGSMGTTLSMVDADEDDDFMDDSPRTDPSMGDSYVSPGDHPSNKWGKSSPTPDGPSHAFNHAAKSDDLNSWMK